MRQRAKLYLCGAFENRKTGPKMFGLNNMVSQRNENGKIP